MERSYVEAPDIAIQVGQTSSNILGREAFADAEAFALFAVAAGDSSKTYNIQISPDKGVTWYNWHDGSSNVTAPVPSGAPSLMSTYGQPVGSAIRIQASANVASVTSWKVIKSVVN